MLADSDGLFVLSMVEDRAYRKCKDLPSWVPDYSVANASGLGMIKRGLYSASQNSKQEGRIQKGSRILSLDAAELDIITEVGETKLEMRANYCYPQWLRIIAGMDPTYLTGQSRVEAFWRTLIGDSHRDPTTSDRDYPALKSLETSFRNWLLFAAALGVDKARKSDVSSGVSEETLACLDGLAKDDPGGVIPTSDEVHQFAEQWLCQPGSLETIPDEAARPSVHYDFSFIVVSFKEFSSTEKGFMGL